MAKRVWQPPKEIKIPAALVGAGVELEKDWRDRLIGTNWDRLDEIGEGLFGDGNEVAHTDESLGHKSGPVGQVFHDRLHSQTEGHSNLLAVKNPNHVPQLVPPMVMITKVTIKGARQAVQMFGPAQSGFARCLDFLRGCFGPRPEDLRIVAGIFVHWQAEDNVRIGRYQALATALATMRALGIVPNGKEARHPFDGLPEDVDLNEVLFGTEAEFASKYPRAAKAAAAS